MLLERSLNESNNNMAAVGRIYSRRRKHNETRSWATKYRGPIAIHAAVKPIRQVVPLLSEKAFGLMVEKLEKASMANGELLTYFNYGEVIATAELVACHLITEEYLSVLS